MTTNFWKELPREELDKHYNPTLWTPRLTPDSLLPKHQEFTTRASNDHKNSLIERNLFESIQVGDGNYKSEIDICKPDQTIDQKTALIYIHGGWWQWFSKEQFTFVAKPFTDKGITVYLPGYTMAQDWNNASNPIQEIFTQVKLAIVQLLKDTDRNNIDKVFITGHSAGGHLAAMMALVDWKKEFDLTKNQVQRLKGVISLSGLFDVRPLVDTFVNDAIKIDNEEAEKVSPYYLLNELSKDFKPLPTFLALPEYDPQEFYRQTREYQSLMHNKGHHCDLFFIPKTDHLDIIENFYSENYVLTDYIIDIIQNRY